MQVMQIALENTLHQYKSKANTAKFKRKYNHIIQMNLLKKKSNPQNAQTSEKSNGLIAAKYTETQAQKPHIKMGFL
jgi:hypothetical protein